MTTLADLAAIEEAEKQEGLPRPYAGLIPSSPPAPRVEKYDPEEEVVALKSWADESYGLELEQPAPPALYEDEGDHDPEAKLNYLTPMYDTGMFRAGEPVAKARLVPTVELDLEPGEANEGYQVLNAQLRDALRAAAVVEDPEEKARFNATAERIMSQMDPSHVRFMQAEQGMASFTESLMALVAINAAFPLKFLGTSSGGNALRTGIHLALVDFAGSGGDMQAAKNGLMMGMSLSANSSVAKALAGKIPGKALSQVAGVAAGGSALPFFTAQNMMMGMNPQEAVMHATGSLLMFESLGMGARIQQVQNSRPVREYLRAKENAVKTAMERHARLAAVNLAEVSKYERLEQLKAELAKGEKHQYPTVSLIREDGSRLRGLLVGEDKNSAMIMSGGRGKNAKLEIVDKAAYSVEGGLTKKKPFRERLKELKPQETLKQDPRTMTVKEMMAEGNYYFEQAQAARKEAKLVEQATGKKAATMEDLGGQARHDRMNALAAETTKRFGFNQALQNMKENPTPGELKEAKNSGLLPNAIKQAGDRVAAVAKAVDQSDAISRKKTIGFIDTVVQEVAKRGGSDKGVLATLDAIAADPNVKGVGPARIEIVKQAILHDNPSDAISSINLIRRSTNPTARLIPVPARTSRPKLGMGNAERLELIDAMPRRVANDPVGSAMVHRLMEDLQMTLPADPLARQRAKQYLVEIATRAWDINRNGLPAKDWNNPRFQGKMGVARKAYGHGSSRRHTIADIALMLADPKLTTMEMEMQRGVAIGNNNPTRRFDFMLREAASEMKSTRAYLVPTTLLESTPEMRNAFAQILNTDPNANLKQGKRKFTGKEWINAQWDIMESYVRASKTKHPEQWMSYYKKLATLMAESAQSVEAAHARMGQTYRWAEWWEDGNGKQLEALEKLTHRSRKQEAKLKELQAQEAERMPWFYDKAAKEPKQVDRTTIKKAWDIYRSKESPADAYDALFAHMSTEKWGTREYYWMAERDLEMVHRPYPLTQEVPQEAPAKRIGTAQKFDQAFYPRKGHMLKPQDGPVLAAYARHMQKLEVSARNYWPGKEISDRVKAAAREARIDPALADNVVRQTNGALGQPQGTPHWVTSAFIAGNSAFWNAYPLALSRAFYFNARNMAWQGTPYGPAMTQVSPMDAAAGWNKSVWDKWFNPNSRGNLSTERKIHSDMDQKQGIHQGVMLAQDEANAQKMDRFNVASAIQKRATKGMRDTASSDLGIWAADRMRAYQAYALTISDTKNRKLIYPTFYNVAEKYAGEYLQRMPWGADYPAAFGAEERMWKGLNISNLHPMTRLELMQQFQQLAKTQPKTSDMQKRLDHFDPFFERYAEIRNENVNGIYRQSGRTAGEVDPNVRPFLGILTFPRINFELYTRHGAQPIGEAAGRFQQNLKTAKQDKGLRGYQAAREAWTPLETEQFNSGMRTIGYNIISHTIGTIMASELLGNKWTYDREEGWEPMEVIGTVSSAMFSPYTPGMDFVKGMFEKESYYGLGEAAAMIGDTIASDLSDEEFLDKYDRILSKYAWFLPLTDDLANIMEASSNTAGLSRVEALRAALGGRMAEGENFADRSALEMFRHMFLGTDEYGDDRDLADKFWDALELNELPGAAGEKFDEWYEEEVRDR